MTNIRHNLTKSERRKRRVRAKLFGTADRPRVSVFRSNQYLYVQAINDQGGETLAAAHDKQVRNKSKKSSLTKMEAAAKSAESLAKQLKAQDITQVVFDRGSYKYHGRVKVVAETLREAGINV